MAKNKKRKQNKTKQADHSESKQEVNAESIQKQMQQEQIMPDKQQQQKINDTIQKIQQALKLSGQKSQNNKQKQHSQKEQSQQLSKVAVMSVNSLQDQYDNIIQDQHQKDFDEHLDNIRCRSQSKNKKKKKKKKKHLQQHQKSQISQYSQLSLHSQQQNYQNSHHEKQTQKKSQNNSQTQSFSDKVKQEKFNIFQKLLKLKANMESQKPKQHSKFLDKVADKIIFDATHNLEQRQKKVQGPKGKTRQIKKIKKIQQQIKGNQNQPKLIEEINVKKQQTKPQKTIEVVVDTPQKPKIKLLTFSSLKEDQIPIMEPTQEQYNNQVNQEQNSKITISAGAFNKKVKKIIFQPQPQHQIQHQPQIMQTYQGKTDKQIIDQSLMKDQIDNQDLIVRTLQKEHQPIALEQSQMDSNTSLQQDPIQKRQVKQPQNFEPLVEQNKQISEQTQAMQIPHIHISCVKSQASSSKQQNQQQNQNQNQNQSTMLQSEEASPLININYAKSQASDINQSQLQNDGLYNQLKMPKLQQDILSQSYSDDKKKSQSSDQKMDWGMQMKELITCKSNQALNKTPVKQSPFVSTQSFQISMDSPQPNNLSIKSPNNVDMIDSYDFGQNQNEQKLKSCQNQSTQIDVMQRLGKLFEQQNSKHKSRMKDHQKFFGQDVGDDQSLIKQVAQSQQFQINESQLNQQKNDDNKKTGVLTQSQYFKEDEEQMNLQLSNSNYCQIENTNNKKEGNKPACQGISNNSNEMFNLQLSNLQNESTPYFQQGISNSNLQNESTPYFQQGILNSNIQNIQVPEQSNTADNIQPNIENEEVSSKNKEENNQVLDLTTEIKVPMQINDYQSNKLSKIVNDQTILNNLSENKKKQQHRQGQLKITQQYPNQLEQTNQTQEKDNANYIQTLIQCQDQMLRTIEQAKMKVKVQCSLAIDLDNKIWKPINKLKQQTNQEQSQSQLQNQQTLKIIQKSASSPIKYKQSQKVDLKQKYFFTKYNPNQSLSLNIMNVNLNNFSSSPFKRSIEASTITNTNTLTNKLQPIKNQYSYQNLKRVQSNKESFILKESNETMSKSFIKKRVFKNIQTEQKENKLNKIKNETQKQVIQQNYQDYDHQKELEEVTSIMKMQQLILMSQVHQPPTIIDSADTYANYANYSNYSPKKDNKSSLIIQIPNPNPTLHQSPQKKMHSLSSRSAKKLREDMSSELYQNGYTSTQLNQNYPIRYNQLDLNSQNFHLLNQSRKSQQIQPSILNYKRINQHQTRNESEQKQSSQNVLSNKLYPSNFKYSAEQSSQMQIQKMGSMQMDSLKQFYHQINNKDGNYYQEAQHQDYNQRNGERQYVDTLILQDRESYIIPETQKKVDPKVIGAQYNDREAQFQQCNQKFTPQSVNATKQIFFNNSNNYDSSNGILGQNQQNYPFFPVYSLTTINIMNHFNPLKKMHTIDQKQKPIVKISYNKKSQLIQPQLQHQNLNAENNKQSNSKSHQKKITVQLKQKQQIKNQHNKNANPKMFSYNNNTSSKYTENVDNSNLFNRQNYANFSNNYQTQVKNKQRITTQDREKSSKKIQITFTSRVPNKIEGQNLLRSKQKIHIKLQDQTKKSTLKQELFKQKLKKTIGIKAINKQISSKIEQKTKTKKQKLTLNQGNLKTKAEQTTVNNGQTFNSFQDSKHVQKLKQSIQRLVYNKNKNIFENVKNRISSRSRSHMSRYSKQKQSLDEDFGLSSPQSKKNQLSRYVTEQICQHEYSAGKSSSSRRSGLSKWNQDISSLKKSREQHGKFSPKIFNQPRDKSKAERIIGITKWNQNIGEYKKQHEKQRSRSKSSKYESRISSKYQKSNQVSGNKLKAYESGSKIGVQIKKHKYQTNNVKMHYL